MRADVAMRESKDGYIYCGGSKAYLCLGVLHWYDNREDVSLDHTLSNNWQPSKPSELCEACKEAEVLAKSSWAAYTGMAAHLRNRHCTCKKEE